MVAKSLFGFTPEGHQVDLYRITNSAKTELSIINYGAIIQSLKVPDRHGVIENVVLGFSDLPGYLSDTNYLGAIAGRHAGRIANGKFKLDGIEYSLAQNERGNHLHGGVKGFHKVIWSTEIISDKGILLSYLSPDGEEGYPGNLQASVKYTLTESNEVYVEIRASTDRATIVNLVQHSYFNLSAKKESALEQVLEIDADSFIKVDEKLIPEGTVSPVENTPFDFRKPVSIGARIKSDHEQLKFANGYDHNWIVNHPKNGIREVAELYDNRSGRKLTVSSDLPALLMYSGNFLSGDFSQHGGVCLETQQFPHPPDHPDFLSSVFSPSKPYYSTTIFKFSCE